MNIILRLVGRMKLIEMVFCIVLANTPTLDLMWEGLTMNRLEMNVARIGVDKMQAVLSGISGGDLNTGIIKQKLQFNALCLRSIDIAFLKLTTERSADYVKN